MNIAKTGSYFNYPIFIFFLFLLLAGCGGSSPATDDALAQLANGGVVHEEPRNGAGATEGPPAEFTDAKTKWERARIQTYQFSYERICFCIPEGSITVIVREGKAERAYYSFTGVQLSEEHLKRVPTLATLFETAQDGYLRNAAEVRFTANANFGYLENLYIDYDRQMADEEIGYKVNDFSYQVL